MGLLDLFLVASMPVLKTLLLTILGSFLASDRIGVLGENARKQLNNVVFFVFSPALVGSNLARTMTLEGFALLWFMPFNILCTFIIGSLMAWILIKITRAPHHLRGLVLGCCCAGNLGNLPLIIIPAVCREKGSPFGDPEICYKYGMTYVSLSMATGVIYFWTYVYNIVRVSSSKVTINEDKKEEFTSKMKTIEATPESVQNNSPLLSKTSILGKTKQRLKMISRTLNLKALFAPSTIGAILGFIIGVNPRIRSLMIGDTAPLHVIEDSASLLGDATIPTVTLVIGGNLLRGLKGSGIQGSLIIGIIAIRYVFLPLLGILIVKAAVHYGMVHCDPLYQFVLLLQYALPPAMNIGTVTQLFGAGESECSIVMLWAYALASVSLTLWSTLFLWLVA
ncbi:Auxin efflux carrier family protein [Melia azedarach]|uniref:Auxin efflux carrier family protein n=1 Tax=Melia azedarach TaxID=155640 RepID=A0ACC1XWM4_MELAZ|nr:Auxin efflux carrier family protein [Melia azedarach]